MDKRILDELKTMESERGVRVLLAVESGSRAWGMASADSDYDVRFVFCRRPAEYLRLESLRDTIEWKLDETLDITGWDLQKFLRLARGSNPTAFEWLSSSIVYTEAASFARVRETVARSFSPKASAFHYLGMAHNNARDFLSEETAKVKKYLYVTRALLCARWCLEERTPAPIRLSEIVYVKLPDELRGIVDGLLETKATGPEGVRIKHIPTLDEWIASEDTTLHALAQAEPSPRKVPWDDFDRVFLDIVCEGTPLA